MNHVHGFTTTVMFSPCGVFQAIFPICQQSVTESCKNIFLQEIAPLLKLSMSHSIPTDHWSCTFTIPFFHYYSGSSYSKANIFEKVITKMPWGVGHEMTDGTELAIYQLIYHLTRQVDLIVLLKTTIISYWLYFPKMTRGHIHWWYMLTMV